MGVPFKKIARKDPRKADAVEKFYPQLVTTGPNADLDAVAFKMKEKSSLTLGDIQSVLTNFVEAMREVFSQYQELRCVQPLGTDLRDGRCKRVHRQKHQSGENKFPTFNQHPTGYYNHTRRRENRLL